MVHTTGALAEKRLIAVITKLFFTALLVAMMLGLLAGPASGTQDQLEAPADSQVAVTFVTLRNKTGNAPSDNYFGGTRDRLRTGICTVAFSPLWGLEQIAETAPFYIPSEKHTISAISELLEDRFWDNISTLAKRSQGNIVLYIHGYKIGFDRSCHRAALFQRVLNPQDQMILFSWPADGTLIKYSWDVSDMMWSIPFLEKLLEGLVGRLGNERVDVVAHSLGTRGVVTALSRLACRQPTRKVLNELILVAPDIDTDNFGHMLPDIRPQVNRITIYASENDKALMASEEFNGHPRLGQAGNNLTVFKGVQTIDISAIGISRFSGHVYHLYNPAVVKDLTDLLDTGKPAGQRSGLEEATQKGLPYWRLQPPPDSR